MRKTVVLFLSILILLLGILVSCSGEGVVDEAFTATVTFNGNGATSGSMAAQKVGRGSDTRLEANAFEKTFYRFTGWNTESDGSGTAYTEGQIINAKENITLYAQWELDAVVLTSSTKYWTDGNAYTLNSDVTIDDWVSVTGNVALILPDGYTLTASNGIVVTEGNSLTINGEGSGTLISTGGGGCAGIGGWIDNENHDCGNITINGGTVNATSINGGAGIGGGVNGSGGNITINGGTVTAGSSYLGAAGIGKGAGGTDDGTLALGDGITLKVSDDNIYWSDYDGTTRERYMKTV